MNPKVGDIAVATRAGLDITKGNKYKILVVGSIKRVGRVHVRVLDDVGDRWWLDNYKLLNITNTIGGKIL